MANVTSEDMQALTSALLKLVDEVGDGAHHTTDVLSAIESRMDDVRDELKTLNATLNNIGFGGVSYPGALEKQAMELARIADALDLFMSEEESAEAGE